VTLPVRVIFMFLLLAVFERLSLNELPQFRYRDRMFVTDWHGGHLLRQY